MALLAQQALPIAALFPSSFSCVNYDSGSLDNTHSCTTTSGHAYLVWSASLSPRNRLRAITKRQPARIKCSSRGCNGNYGGNCRDNFSCRALPLVSNFQRFPLLQLCIPMGFLTRPTFGLSWSRTKSSTCRLSCNVVANVNSLPKRHCIGVVGLSGQKPQRRRASRGNGNGSSEEEDEEDEETFQEITQEGDEAQGSGDDDSEPTEERQDGDKQEIPIESAIGSGEDTPADNEAGAPSEEPKTGFWRKIWEPEQKEEDVALDPEKESLLKDVESLSFNWKALLEPSWDNVLALFFAALLTIASFKILFQLVLVSITVLLSALKYAVLAAFLLGLLIFLL